MKNFFQLLAGLLLSIIFINAPLNSNTEDNPYKILRQRMVAEQIESRGVQKKNVLQALLTVPRHQFVPGNQTKHAYEDRPLPIGYGQTISQPYIVGYMTEIINPEPTQRILEIGTGSGYQAAILAEIVREVFTVEIISELGQSAAEHLKRLGYKKINVKIADGYYGWPEKAPFDAIVVTAAAEYIPPPLIDQLKDGGKMIIPVGSPFLVQTLMLVEKNKNKITTRSLMPVRFVPLRKDK